MADNVQKILGLFGLGTHGFIASHTEPLQVTPLKAVKPVNEGDDVLSAAKNSLNKAIQAVTTLDKAAALKVCTEEWNKLYTISTTRPMCEAEQTAFFNIAEQVYTMTQRKPQEIVPMPNAASRLQRATIKLFSPLAMAK